MCIVNYGIRRLDVAAIDLPAPQVAATWPAQKINCPDPELRPALPAPAAVRIARPVLA